jgi:hypothetical protein
MSERQNSPMPRTRSSTVDELRHQLRDQLDSIISFCLSDPAPTSFLNLVATRLPGSDGGLDLP